MKRLEDFFEKAQSCEKETRKIGFETESLFVSKSNGKVISLKTSQLIMKKLVNDFGHKVEEEKNGFVTKVIKNGFSIFYELGWNNFELITPPFEVREVNNLFFSYNKVLEELRLAGESSGAELLSKSWDKEVSNTLVMPDKRDEVWLKLDGPVLFSLGHIACIHLNIELVSINEGMNWIKKLNAYYNQEGWPFGDNLSIWQKYIANSFAKYEKDRYGQTPSNFLDYCKKLSEYKVVMNCSKGDLSIIDFPLPFVQTKEVDLNLFLRSVWWWSRLRVREGRLVLEIRDIPRSLGVEKSFSLMSSLLSF